MDEYDIRILLVEDDDGHAELVKLNLQRCRFVKEVMNFSSGKHALEFLARDALLHRYLIILDINMPGLDGQQVLTRLKGDTRTRSIPVIVLTTAEDDREVERCYALGGNFYMTKPMEYPAFCNAVHELGLFIRNARLPASSVAAK